MKFIAAPASMGASCSPQNQTLILKFPSNYGALADRRDDRTIIQMQPDEESNKQGNRTTIGRKLRFVVNLISVFTIGFIINRLYINHCEQQLIADVMRRNGITQFQVEQKNVVHRIVTVSYSEWKLSVTETPQVTEFINESDGDVRLMKAVVQGLKGEFNDGQVWRDWIDGCDVYFCFVKSSNHIYAYILHH